MSGYVRKWKEVSPRMMWAKMKLGSKVWMYGPGSEKSVDERKEF